MAAANVSDMEDPRDLLARSSMAWRQYLAIAICVALNALDGFDVLSISFAAPGLAAEWGIDRAALGVVLSMELVGMALGSLLLGPMADRHGRRPTVLLCLVIMAIGMFATTRVDAMGQLAAARLFTGLGIGGMLACINAMAAEFANDRWRSTAVAIMAAGYPLGAILGGSIVTLLLRDGDWRDVFRFGAIATAAFIPLVLLLVPETVGFIMQKRPENVLARVNRALRALGHAPVNRLADSRAEAAAKISWTTLFSTDLRRVTIFLTLAYFFHIMTFYFILKWVPKIVVDMGYSPSLAGGVLVWANVGGLAGSLLFGLLALRLGLRGMLIGALLGSAALVALFGREQHGLAGLSSAAAMGGFFANAAVVGIYALIARSFPTAVRAGGTGFVVGMGRGGAALSPMVAGLLFNTGLALPMVAAVMAGGSLLAALALLGLPRGKDHRHKALSAGTR